MATLLGGRWDGLHVEYVGPMMEFRGDEYVAMRRAVLRDGELQIYYLLAALREEWLIFDSSGAE